ncbi:MAG: carbohydrate ABC transporter permease [Spirochaetes bacterium]|nr:carbohydrate ABC transporter permease [Spirochaetota bacterium]
MKRTTIGRGLFLIINNSILITLVLTMIIPLLNVLAVSFTTDMESYENTIKLFPRQPSLIGYITLFQRVAILRPFLNNIFVTVIGTFLHVVFCAMAGYVLTKENFLGKAIIAALIIIPNMLPFEMIIIPVFVTVKKLGLMDTLWSIILIKVISTFSILLMKNYFEGIPKSLEESAFIDGAGEYAIFFKIYVPLAVPGMTTITIFQFVALWNQLLPAVLFLNSPEKYTLQIALKSLVVSQELTSTTQSVANNTRMAGIVVAIIPLILLYIFAQKYFIKGIMVGAVKE